MSPTNARAARLAERFTEPAEPDTPVVEVARPAQKSGGRTRKAVKSADATADAPHIKRTFYVRADLVERVEAEARRLNYELGGVRLVEVLNAVLEAGLAQLPTIEADIKTNHT